MKNPMSPARRKTVQTTTVVIAAVVIAAVAALSLLGVIDPPLPVRAALAVLNVALAVLNVALLVLVVRSRRAARRGI